MLISKYFRTSLPIASAAFVAVGLLSVPPPVEATAATVGIAVKTYPLPPKSTPAQLGPRAQRRLPKIKRWTTRVIGNKMDQPAGLTDVQVVSALHIRRVFRRQLGKAAWRSAIRISWRESRLLPNVVNDKNTNGTSDLGLFQLNDGGTLQYAGLEPGTRALHPRRNARAARYVVMTTGWWPWGGML